MMKGYAWVLLLAIASMECFAGLNEGFTAYKAGKYKTALKEFLPLANDGDATAQFSLGFMYEKGQGVAQDYSQAADWYRKAAVQGDAEAINNLGLMYDKGEGVPQNYRLAAVLYHKAAAQGHASSQPIGIVRPQYKAMRKLLII